MPEKVKVEILDGILPLEEKVRRYEFDFVPDERARNLNRKRKRIVDIILASLGLIATTPIIAVAALVVKLDSKGPAFYKSKRVDEDGRVFHAYKLRTMYVNSNQYGWAYGVSQCRTLDDVFIVQNPNDSRITKVGRILRRYSIDELPQFLNVVKGDMSMVGPRPLGDEARRFVEYALSTRNYRYLEIFYCPAGMTSNAAIHGRGDLPKAQRVEHDLEYAREFNTKNILGLDMQIIGRTCKILLTGKGAY